MTTIAYDKSIKDLIADLNATDHVTHTAYRKTMVTLHHNGGRLSHEGVLNVWKTRPASAHFDVDGSGAVAQYVKVNEYAWACGNTAGNQKSISIEMANSAVGGVWPVATATWQSAARLAGWLFARVIGARPTKETLVPHHYWKSTNCAGPFVDAYFNKILAEAQAWYDAFVHHLNSKDDDMPTPAEFWGYHRKGETKDASQLLKDAADNSARAAHYSNAESSEILAELKKLNENFTNFVNQMQQNK